MDKINLAEKFAKFSEHWKPKIVAELNDCYVKVAKFQGEFVWHRHDAEDELFLVTRGTMLLRLRDRDLSVGPGELIVVPAGVDHCPVAADEVHAVLIEKKTTVNTGEVRDSRTLESLDRI